MKKLLLIAAVMSVPCVAFAQQPVVPAEYVLKVKPDDVDKIGRGLSKLSFEEVAALMQSLREQVLEQQKPAATPDKK